MSIIYNTLERIEAENPVPMQDKKQAGAILADARPGLVPLKIVVAVIAVFIATAALSLMQMNQPVEVASQTELVSAGEVERVPVSTPAPVEPEVADSAVVGAVVSAAEPVTAVVETLPDSRPASKPVVEATAVAAEASSPLVSIEVAPELAQVTVVEQGIAQQQEPGPGDGIDEAVEQARFALARGLFLQALSVLSDLESAPRDRADFWLVKGSAHLGLGELEMAENALTSAQSLAPDNVQILVQRAILSQEQGDHLVALRLLEGAAIRHPDTPEVFLNLGYSQLALEAENDARRSFRTFLAMTRNRSLYAQQRSAVQHWLERASFARL